VRGDARSDKGDSIAVASWSGRGGDVMRRDAMHQRRGVMAWRRGVNDASQPGLCDGAPGQQLHQGHGRRAGSAAASRASAPGQQLRPAAGRAGSGPGRADAGPDRQRPAGPAHQGGSSTRAAGPALQDRQQASRASAPGRQLNPAAGRAAAVVHRAAHRPANGQRAEPGRRWARSAAGSQGGELSRTHYARARQASRPGSRQPCQPLARGNINRTCARCPPKKFFSPL